MSNFYTSGALIFILCFMGITTPQANGQSFDVCQLYGQVYVANSEQEANFRVYLEESEAFADLTVYREDNKLFADKPGLWFIVETQAFANFSICWVNDRNLADFSIYYTDILSFAGCNK